MINPLFDHILVEPIEIENVTAGGIYLTDMTPKKTQWGVVVALGQGRVIGSEVHPFEPLINVGDRILFSKYGFTEVTSDGKDYLLISARDVKAVEHG